MKRTLSLLSLITLSLFANSCSDNQISNPSAENLVLQLDGVIEELGGDCSAVQVRTRSLGQLDLSQTEKVKFTFNGMSDADLSSISIFHVENGINVNLVNLPDRDAINSTNSIEIQSPGINTELFLRVTLQSSVCTGHIFFLRVSDLKIYTVQ